MRLPTGVQLLVLSALWVVPPVSAHHSFAAVYDPDRTIEFTGTVVRVEWTNPHIYTVIRVEDEDGTAVEYRAEGSAPNGLFRNGWRPDTVVPGDIVHFTGSPARSETSTNVSGEIRNEDGLRLFSGRAPSE